MKINKIKAEKFAKSICYSKEGLVPVAVSDSESGRLLMLAYANGKAVIRTLTTGSAWFFSRSRNSLWKKGEESGNTMRVLSVSVDCDSDALQYLVRVEGKGNACHNGRESCFEMRFGSGEDRLTIAGLASVIEQRMREKSAASYTVKLAANRKLACAKIEEESKELAEALQKKNKREVAWEACDLIYHALVAARARGVSLSDLEKELGRRNREK